MRGDVVLAAQVAVSRRNPRRGTPTTRAVDASVPQTRPDLPGFVAAASVAVGRLADAIADTLSG